MKTIYKGKDDLYYTISIKSEKGSIILPNDLDVCTIEFFTSGTEKAVFESEDISPEGVLHVNASDLQDLPDGPLKARFHIGLEDDNYNDGVFDQMSTRLTGYFLKSLPQSPANASTQE